MLEKGKRIVVYGCVCLGGVHTCAFVYIKYFWKVHKKLITWVASEDLNGYKMLAEGDIYLRILYLLKLNHVNHFPINYNYKTGKICEAQRGRAVPECHTAVWSQNQHPFLYLQAPHFVFLAIIPCCWFLPLEMVRKNLSTLLTSKLEYISPADIINLVLCQSCCFPLS